MSQKTIMVINPIVVEKTKKCQPFSGATEKVSGSSNPPGTVNVYTMFHGNPSTGCGDISV